MVLEEVLEREEGERMVARFRAWQRGAATSTGR